MSYDITKTDGTRLTIVADRTIDVTTPIKLVGKNYAGYGEIMAENLVQMLEHFSNPAAPANPIVGQQWWNSAEKVLYVYSATGWNPMGGEGVLGGLTTGFKIAPIQDTSGTFHPSIQATCGGVVVFIISSDAGTYTPGGVDSALASRFPVIGQGINMNDGQDSGAEYGNFKIRGRTMEAEFADMAEIYKSDTLLLPGNLVTLGGTSEITKTSKAFDDQIFGVISTAPGFLLNAKEKLKEFAYPVALKGRVPCLIDGPVRKGQRIVASDIAGVGMATDTFDAAAIIGRAIGTKQSDGVGLVEVAVGVR
jgi:hypothetical protein